MIERVFILGAGRAGRGLARALRASGAEIVGLHGTHPEAGEDPVTAGPLPPTVSRADVILVTVRDAPWRAHTNRATPVSAGEQLRVVAIDGLVLEVEPLEGAAKDSRRS